MTAAQLKQAHNADLFVDMLADDKEHIDRAKAKAKAVKTAQERARKLEQARQRKAAEQARVTRRMEITASATVLVAGLWTFLAAWLA